MFFLKNIWLIPLLPAVGAALMLFFGRKLRKVTVNAVCVGAVVNRSVINERVFIGAVLSSFDPAATGFGAPAHPVSANAAATRRMH